MDTRLMQLLVCPVCKGPLTHAHDTRELICPVDRLAFPIRDGIAIMLEGEARPVDPDAGTSAPTPAAPTPTPSAA